MTNSPKISQVKNTSGLQVFLSPIQFCVFTVLNFPEVVTGLAHSSFINGQPYHSQVLAPQLLIKGTLSSQNSITTATILLDACEKHVLRWLPALRRAKRSPFSTTLHQALTLWKAYPASDDLEALPILKHSRSSKGWGEHGFTAAVAFCNNT